MKQAQVTNPPYLPPNLSQKNANEYGNTKGPGLNRPRRFGVFLGRSTHHIDRLTRKQRQHMSQFAAHFAAVNNAIDSTLLK